MAYGYGSPQTSSKSTSWDSQVDPALLAEYKKSGNYSGSVNDFNAWNANTQNQRNQDRRDTEHRAFVSSENTRLAELADPFRGERSQYQGQLKDLMTDPTGALDKNPFFKANMAAGQDAAMRRLRALGMGTSGNAAYELQNNAMANQSGNFFKLADLLGGFSGAKQPSSPQQIVPSFNTPNQQFGGGGYGSGGTSMNTRPISSNQLANYWGGGSVIGQPFFGGS